MNDTKRKYMQWCNDCPKAYDDTCSGADVKRCEVERKARIFNESVMKQKNYVEKEPVKIQPVNQWISVKDRLPDKSCECLGVVDGEVTEVSYDPKQKRLICVWSMCDADGFKPLSDDAVTHWMPLPELPKDGDTNG